MQSTSTSVPVVGGGDDDESGVGGGDGDGDGSGVGGGDGSEVDGGGPEVRLTGGTDVALLDVTGVVSNLLREAAVVSAWGKLSIVAATDVGRGEVAFTPAVPRAGADVADVTVSESPPLHDPTTSASAAASAALVLAVTRSIMPTDPSLSVAALSVSRSIDRYFHEKS